MTERLRILIHISNYFQTLEIPGKMLSDKNEPNTRDSTSRACHLFEVLIRFAQGRVQSRSDWLVGVCARACSLRSVHRVYASTIVLEYAESRLKSLTSTAHTPSDDFSRLNFFRRRDISRATHHPWLRSNASLDYGRKSVGEKFAAPGYAFVLRVMRHYFGGP